MAVVALQFERLVQHAATTATQHANIEQFDKIPRHGHNLTCIFSPRNDKGAVIEPIGPHLNTIVHAAVTAAGLSSD